MDDGDLIWSTRQVKCPIKLKEVIDETDDLEPDGSQLLRAD